MVEKELTDVGAGRTSTSLLFTIPQSASNYTVIHSIAAIFAQWGWVVAGAVSRRHLAVLSWKQTVLIKYQLCADLLSGKWLRLVC